MLNLTDFLCAIRYSWTVSRWSAEWVMNLTLDLRVSSFTHHLLYWFPVVRVQVSRSLSSQLGLVFSCCFPESEEAWLPWFVGGGSLLKLFFFLSFFPFFFPCFGGKLLLTPFLFLSFFVAFFLLLLALITSIKSSQDFKLTLPQWFITLDAVVS